MGVRAGIIKCPFCKSHLQDTRQEFIDCRFCGKRFKRGTAKEEEEELRRNMVLDLSDKVNKMKTIISAGKIFGLIFLLFGVLMLFSRIFDFMELIITVAFFTCCGVWFGIMAVYGKKMEKTQSKLFDLSGGRDVFEY